MNRPGRDVPRTGQRFTVRRRRPDGGVGDVIGVLIFHDDQQLVLTDRRGRNHTIARADVIASRRVPDRPGGTR